MSFSLGRDRRLRKSSDFQNARRNGKSWVNALLVLQVCPNGQEKTRIGFSVGRRVGNAVVRNRIKRRLRAVARMAPLNEGMDMVFIARAPASQASFQELEGAVARLVAAAKVVADPKRTGACGL